jgi:predicted GNAT family N-acyltransferase
VTEVRPAQDAAEVQGALAVRHEAFVVEQGVPPEEELDGRDDEAVHLVAVAGGRVLATCRLLDEGAAWHLGRMAVSAAARRKGLATALLTEAERLARLGGAGRMTLHAQTGALALYERAGYMARGERFMDCGIEHLTMEKDLA